MVANLTKPGVVDMNCLPMEGHKTTYELLSYPEIKSEYLQTPRSNYKFTGNAGGGGTW